MITGRCNVWTGAGASVACARNGTFAGRNEVSGRESNYSNFMKSCIVCGNRYGYSS